MRDTRAMARAVIPKVRTSPHYSQYLASPQHSALHCPRVNRWQLTASPSLCVLWLALYCCSNAPYSLPRLWPRNQSCCAELSALWQTPRPRHRSSQTTHQRVSQMGARDPRRLRNPPHLSPIDEHVFGRAELRGTRNCVLQGDWILPETQLRRGCRRDRETAVHAHDHSLLTVWSESAAVARGVARAFGTSARHSLVPAYVVAPVCADRPSPYASDDDARSARLAALAIRRLAATALSPSNSSRFTTSA
jgi:hypothetical protein